MADTKTFTSPVEEIAARVDSANQSGPEGLATLAPLTIPATNMVVVVNVEAGVELPIAFSLDDAQIEIVEADLHLNFANGSTIVLEGFAELSSIENPPAIVMADGTVLPADAVLLPYLDADSAPAAGPTVTSGGVGTYRSDLGQVIEGVDRLGTQDAPTLTSVDGTELDDQGLLVDEQGPPDAVDDMAITDEDSSVVIQVLPNDSDPDGDPLEVVSFTQPELGTVSQNIDGTFTYDPNGQFDGLAVGESATETFTYTISDGQGGSDMATVNVTINGINDPPVIDLEATDSAAVVSDEGLADASPDTIGSDDTTNLDTDSGQIVFTDVDITDVHTVTLTAPSESLSSGGTELVWTGSGTGTLVGTAGQGGSLVITISIDNNGNYTVDQDAPIDHPLADVEDDLSFDVGVTVTDDSGAVNNSATAAITVTVEDDSPTVGDVSLGTQAEDAVVNLNVFDIPGTEGGADGATLTDVTIDQGAGSVVFDANGDVTFSPADEYAGPVSLSYTITDADNDPAQGTIDLTMPSDSAPTVDSGEGTVYEAGLVPDGSDAGGVATSTSGLFNIDTGNDSFGGLYIDGVHADHGATFVSANGYGTLTITESGGQWGWVYSVSEDETHAAGGGNNTLSDSFTVTVLDHEGTTSTEQSIDITIVDDIPLVDIVAAATDSTPTTDSVVEDGATLNGTWISEYGADTDTNDAATAPATIKVTVDGGATTYDLDTAISTGYGTLMVNSDATWSFDPVPVEQPRDVEFTVTITDADGDAKSDSHTITILDGSGPGDAADVNLTVAEADLPTAVIDSDTIDFTPGADALTSMVFSGAVGTISGDYADAAITWAGGNTDTLSGTVTGEPGATIVLTLTGIDLNSGDATVSVTMSDEFKHTTGLDNNTFTIEDIEVVITDTDLTEATGMINVTVVDDIPLVDIVAAATDSTPTTDSVVEDGATLNGTWISEYGADTDTNDAATAPATIKVTVDGGATTYDLDTAISTGYGTLMVNSDATWSFDPVPVEQPRDVEFTVTITDADGDAKSDSHTITILDGSGPGDAADVNLTVAEADLPTAVIDSDTIDFTPGADALTSMVFSGAVGTISGDYADAAITWAGGNTDTLSGTVTGEPGATIVLTLTGIDLNSGDATVSVTMSDEFKHTTGLDNNTFTIEDIEVVITDTDLTEATGMINVTVVDDVAIDIMPDDAELPNLSLATFTGDLDIDGQIEDNIGADQSGNAQFSVSLESTDTGLTSGGLEISYDVSTDGQTLTGYTIAGDIFTIALNTDPANADQYTISMIGTVDGGASVIDFNAGGYDFVGGNGAWAGFSSDDDDSQDLLLTPIGADTVNTNANEGGVGGGNSVGPGEAMRADFVIDLDGNPQGKPYSEISNQDHAFDGHYQVNGSSVMFTHTTGSSVLIKAFDDPDGDNYVTSSVQDDITAVGISYGGEEGFVSFSTVGTTTETVTLNGHDFDVTFDGTEVQIDGVVSETMISSFTADGYNSVEYGHAGGVTFKIGDFGTTVIELGEPVEFSVPVEIVDADGDLADGSIDVLLIPENIIEAADSSQMLMLDDSGVYEFSANGGEGDLVIDGFNIDTDVIRLTDVLDLDSDGSLSLDDVNVGVVAQGSDLVLTIAGSSGIDTSVTLADVGEYSGVDSLDSLAQAGFQVEYTG